MRRVTGNQVAVWTTAVLVVVMLTGSTRVGIDFWMLPDRRAQRMLNAGDAAAAADTFRDPLLRGVAEFRAGQFKEAASTFAGIPGVDAIYNQANARVLLGQYEQAVQLYDLVLRDSPDHEDAKNNRRIAAGRAERLRDDGGEMTGGMLDADGFVFGDQSGNGGGDDVDVDSDMVSDNEIRELWLRQVQTTPRDFLRAKFAFQQSRSGSAVEKDSGR